MPPGTFCWVELGTTDGEAAKKFYTELFGWTFTDSPIGPGMVYTMLKQDGKDVGALYQMKNEMKSREYRHTGCLMCPSTTPMKVQQKQKSSARH